MPVELPCSRTSAASAITSAEWLRPRELVAYGVDARSLRRAVASGDGRPCSAGTVRELLTCPQRSASRCGTGACSPASRWHDSAGSGCCRSTSRARVDGAGRSFARVTPVPCVLHWNAACRTPTEVSLVDALLQIRGCHRGGRRSSRPSSRALHIGELTARSGALDARITESASLARRPRAVPTPRADSNPCSVCACHRIGLHAPDAGRDPRRRSRRLRARRSAHPRGRRRPDHDDPPRRHKDRVRDAVAAAHGFDTLRFDYELVVHDWPVVEAAVLATGRARPPSSKREAERVRSA